MICIGLSFWRAMTLLSWFLATASLSSSKTGRRRISANSSRTSRKSSFRQLIDAEPASVSIEVSMLAALPSRKSSISSPVRDCVPPVRSTIPVNAASPTLSPGS